MKATFAVVVVCVFISLADGQTTPRSLKCRHCLKASSLDDCTYSIPCAAGEICYMDEVVTDRLTLEYNGGCRAREVCQQSRHIVGKRQESTSEPVCSGCCDTKTYPECNTKLCGIKSSSINASQCYHCTSEDPMGGSGVIDPNLCTTLQTCSSNEVCAAETYRLSTHEIYEFKCLNIQVCRVIVQENMKRLESCFSNPAACPRFGGVGRRSSSGHLVCTACCGDSLCNSESCEELISRLYKLYQFGVLDLKTLKRNATLPLTTPQG